MFITENFQLYDGVKLRTPIYKRNKYISGQK